MTDRGEAVAPLYLLIKDHKGWVQESGQAPPSRPVCSGLRGFNRHLSELVSLLLEPVSHSIRGSEIDSTGALLYNIEEYNRKMKAGEVIEVPKEEHKLREEEEKKRDGDAEEFSREMKNQRIRRLRKMKSRHGILPNFKAKLWAVRLADQITGGESILLPNRGSSKRSDRK